MVYQMYLSWLLSFIKGLSILLSLVTTCFYLGRRNLFLCQLSFSLIIISLPIPTPLALPEVLPVPTLLSYSLHYCGHSFPPAICLMMPQLLLSTLSCLSQPVASFLDLFLDLDIPIAFLSRVPNNTLWYNLSQFISYTSLSPKLLNFFCFFILIDYS